MRTIFGGGGGKVLVNGGNKGLGPEREGVWRKGRGWLDVWGKLTCHAGDGHGRPPRQHPPEPFHLALAVAVERDGDLVVEFLDGAVAALLLHADGHLAVVEHPAQVVLERQGVLRRFLRQDVDFVLQVRALRRHLGRAGFARVQDLGAEFGAGGAEEVGFLLGVFSSGELVFKVVGGLWGEKGMGERKLTFSTSDFEISPSFPTFMFTARRLRTAFISVTL